MNLEHVLILLVLGFVAGGVGALAGIGGGIIITPILAIYLGVPMHQAIGISLTAVIATSTATSSVYVEKGLSNIRLGMTLEMATTIGAAIAAIIAGFVDRKTLAILFSVFMLYTAASLVKKAWDSRHQKVETEIPPYEVRRLPAGLGASLVAGGLSGLLGIGGGPIKVPIMFLFMGVPLRVATATSNFMIGVTAATSAYIYYGRGDIPLLYAGPIVVGVFAGSLISARLASKVKTTYILFLLIFVTLYLAINMLWKVWGGKF
ncbi:MAG TPA: sulfite exporter TauE/SafE family protein [Terriglobales bacterium]|nr:sulfite exporter TauE/SafE family protein [Terriglobales bacterium]